AAAMKTSYRRWAIGFVLFCASFGATMSSAAEPALTSRDAQPIFNPPAVPLIACGPYFSVLSPGAKLADADTMHWTGKPHRLRSLVSIDGKAYRVMGGQPLQLPVLRQTNLTIRPTQTDYVFSEAGVELRLTFTTPALPDDIDLLSRPITYLTYSVRSADGR